MSTRDRPPLKVDLRRFSTNEGLSLGDDKGRPFLTRALWMFVNAIVFRNSFLPAYGLKAFLLRRFGARIGEDVVFKPGIHINRPWNLTSATTAGSARRPGSTAAPSCGSVVTS